MTFYKEVILKNNKKCIIRHAEVVGASQVMDCFLITHEETDFLGFYKDESSLTIDQEIEIIQSQKEDPKNVFLVAEVDNKIVGTSGVGVVGKHSKTAHRAYFGISVLKDYWGIGIGKELTIASIEFAKSVGYLQLELDVMENNITALNLYKKLGFKEYGRNPNGFISRYSGIVPLILMHLELKD